MRFVGLFPALFLAVVVIQLSVLVDRVESRCRSYWCRRSRRRGGFTGHRGGNYCAAGVCPVAGSHTACVNKLFSWSSQCVAPNRALSVVTAADKATIVNYHNELRRKVAKGQEWRGLDGAQPPAANMRKLVWNNEIAAIAQTLAQTCKFAHDTCRNLPGMYVGQNLGITMNSAPVRSVDWRNVINMWYNEVKDMNKFVVQSYRSNGRTVGHYTQLVWAETTQIGCGVSAYRGGSWNTLLYVCNYGVGGNMFNRPMYQIGAAASACPRGTRPEDGLCA